jgi:hypothetical protein
MSQTHPRTFVAYILTLLFACTAAPAQPEPPSYAVALRDMPLLCGPGPAYYQISDISAGDVVVVMMSRYEWSKVRTAVRPLEGYIPSASTQPAETPGAVMTISRTRMLAPHYAGIAESVLGLAAIGPGVTLEVIEQTTHRGRPYLRVIAPETAGAWLPNAALRDATPEEIESYLRATQPIEESDEPEATEAAPPADDEPADGDAADQPMEESTEPAALPGDETSTPAGDAGETAENATAEQGEPETVDDHAPLTLDEVRKLSIALMKEPLATAEFEPLIEEIRQLEQAETTTDAERKALERRRELLELRLELQRSLLDIRDARQASEQEFEQLIEEGELVDQAIDRYAVRGKLVPSLVYDGVRLPRLYRLQTIRDDSRRTIAYLEPGEFEGLTKFLGQTVAVSGERRYSPTLKLNVITPIRVEVIRTVEPPSTVGD